MVNKTSIFLAKTSDFTKGKSPFAVTLLRSSYHMLQWQLMSIFRSFHILSQS